MIYNFLLLFFCLNVINKVYSGCARINQFENGLPLSSKGISKNDNVGIIGLTIHQMYVSSMKDLVPSPEMCELKTIKLGKTAFTYSVRPTGCCNICCLIDEIENYVTLYLVKKNQPLKGFKLSNDNQRGKLKAWGIDQNLPTVLYLHGFSESGYSGLSSELVLDAYLSRNESFNLIKADYGKLVALPWYFEAVDNIKLVATALTNFLLFYNETNELPIRNLHVIGLSLGAQLAGHVGKMIGKVKKIPRITGLDPAFPLYFDKDTSERLCENDAEFVDIIHTDAGFFGFPSSMGHADFFINFKKTPQPSCYISDLIKLGLYSEFIVCNHIRAADLYAETVMNPTAYPVESRRNDNFENNSSSWGYMGFLANKSTTLGDFYLYTTSNRTFEISENSRKTYTKFINY